MWFKAGICLYEVRFTAWKKNHFKFLLQEEDVNLFSKKTKTKAARQNRQPGVVGIYIVLVGD